MTRWKVGLSNGESFIEGKGRFECIPNELSPWLKLQNYLKQNNLHITSLSLFNEHGTHNLPSAGKNPKFSPFANAEKPIAYNYFSYVGGDLRRVGVVDEFLVIEAIYQKYKLQIWVDKKNDNNSWVLVKEQNVGR